VAAAAVSDYFPCRPVCSSSETPHTKSYGVSYAHQGLGVRMKCVHTKSYGAI
jgi:hypothetical protein